MDSVFRNMHLKPNPLVNLGHDTILKDNKNITLDAGAGFASYLWSTGSTNRTITVDTSGIGLHSKTFSGIVIKDGCPGLDTIVITFISHIGIQPQSNIEVMIYPNPSGDELNVEILGLNRNIIMAIIDMQGNEVLNIPAVPINGKLKEKIDISRLPSGVYFMKISNEKLLKIEKVLKQ